MKNLLLILVATLAITRLSAQQKIMDHEDFAIWKTIEKPQLSADGRWIIYVLRPGEGDPTLVVFDGQEDRSYEFPRADNAGVSADSRYVVFKIHPLDDTLKAQRRRKVKDKDLTKDTLGIFDLGNRSLNKVARVKSYQLPAKWPGWLAYQLEPALPDTTTVDTTTNENPKKIKKENKDNGTRLVIRNLSDGREDTVSYVKNYIHAEEGSRWLLHTTGDDSTLLAGVYQYDAAGLRPLFRQKGEYKSLTLDKKGQRAAFVADLDTTKAQIRPFGLYHWNGGQDSARQVVAPDADFLPTDWLVSEHARLTFSREANRLFFGIAPPPVLQDTTLLDEEIVNVEVWSYSDGRLHTQQEAELERDKKRSYTCVYHPATGKIVQLGMEEMMDIEPGDEGMAKMALGENTQPYLQQVSWKGFPLCRDLYLVDVETGEAKKIAVNVCGDPRLSPGADYVYWYSNPDTAWFAYSVEQEQLRQITTNDAVAFYDELNDVPDYPSPYGTAGWLKDDAALLVYDRYDIWRIDPEGLEKPVNLTNMREKNQTLRYLRLDPDARFIDPGQPMLTEVFNHVDKTEGHCWIDLEEGPGGLMFYGEYRVGRPVKARQAKRYFFTRENFQVFPDLYYGASLPGSRQISNANPQQEDYAWGTAELYEWNSLNGESLQGILYKPANFDPARQYPMIVYFYDRNSDNLRRYFRPEPGRSIINYSFYTSRGYVVFVPDIPYKNGYPGKSAYDAIIPGVTSILEKGFVDRARIGVQGHSWGGYQVAHLITQTDIFRCAEAGAPVVNMISAYGGIRWQTGLSRMFQYEHTQSRIGGTLWEYPMRYIENSPIFYLDKVHTPVLIMHNDGDGAVPWYQGIEFFVALRRLGKPAWMLNYNDQPHWPLKLQNRKDFQRRMQQFFDYYLKDAPMPRWMEHGVPAIEKGIRQGYETVEKVPVENDK